MIEENERDKWQTPEDLFNDLNKQYKFTFDCCAIADNSKCEHYSSDFETIIPEYEMCWMNPPFSKAQSMLKHFFKYVDRGIVIYRCDNMETKVWQDIILKKASWILIPNYRVTYQGLSNKWNRPVFASALIGFNVEPPKNIKGRLMKSFT